MDSTGAALGDAAAIFRARHSQMIAQHPQQRRRWVGIDALVLPVDRQIVWHLINPEVNYRRIRYRHNRPNWSRMMPDITGRAEGAPMPWNFTRPRRSSGLPLQPWRISDGQLPNGSPGHIGRALGSLVSPN